MWEMIIYIVWKFRTLKTSFFQKPVKCSFFFVFFSLLLWGLNESGKRGYDISSHIYHCANTPSRRHNIARTFHWGDISSRGHIIARIFHRRDIAEKNSLKPQSLYCYFSYLLKICYVKVVINRRDNPDQLLFDPKFE